MVRPHTKAGRERGGGKNERAVVEEQGLLTLCVELDSSHFCIFIKLGCGVLFKPFFFPCNCGERLFICINNYLFQQVPSSLSLSLSNTIL